MNNRSVIRLLIIDDEDEVLLVLKETGRAQGFEVSLAASVAEALRLLADGLAVDLVLCDLTMPDGGAAAWMRACLAAHPELASRTVVITGWAPPSDTDPSAVAGITTERYLCKPFAMSDVRRLAERIIYPV